MCRLSDAELNCVSTKMRRMSACRQLLIGMSMRRYLPPIGTAGFDRRCVSGIQPLPLAAAKDDCQDLGHACGPPCAGPRPRRPGPRGDRAHHAHVQRLERPPAGLNGSPGAVMAGLPCRRGSGHDRRSVAASRDQRPLARTPARPRRPNSCGYLNVTGVTESLHCSGPGSAMIAAPGCRGPDLDGHMFNHRLQHQGRTRGFLISSRAAGGWDVLEEMDRHVVREVHYDDWHRVERQRTCSRCASRASRTKAGRPSTRPAPLRPRRA